MESSPSSPLKINGSADAASETSPVANHSARNFQSSPVRLSREFDSQSPAVSSRSEEYRHLFHLPLEEVLVEDFNCAFQDNILLQGHMYLFIHHICFYSNIFGFETKKVIPSHEITCVRKAKTAGIFPNAIEIFTGDKKYFFASFLSRDEAYRLITDGWSQRSVGAKIILDRQESKSYASGQENGLVPYDKAKSLKQPTNNLESTGRNEDSVTPEESKHPSNEEDAGGHQKQLDVVVENSEEKCADCSSHAETLTWRLEDVDAPKTPGHYTMVAESKFQISAEEFFNLFFSDDAVEFVETFHGKCGDKDFKSTKWYEHEQFGHARNLSFQHPIKIYFGAKFGHCQEVQKFRAYRNSHLIIETSQEINDVPYGDYFQVEGLWDVEQDGIVDHNFCILRVYVYVVFSKKTMWKGKIEQSTVEECREAYALWISNAHELLKQRHKNPKLEGSESDATPASHDNEVGLNNSLEIGGPSEDLLDPRHITSVQLGESNSKDIISRIGKPVMGELNIATSLVSLLRESWTEFCSYLKSQSHWPLIFVIAFVAILLLTQLCIIVLLTRPPKVYFLSEENLMRSYSMEGTETQAWLEKRICHLKDEMLMFEIRLEKMRQEHMLLQSYLQDLDRLKPNL